MTRQLVLDLSTEAFADAIDMLSIIETLEAGNTPAAVAAVRAAKTDAVAVCIYRSLWSRLLAIISRAYADARSGDRHAQYAFDLLKNSAVRAEVERLGNPTALAESIARWTRCRGDHRLNAMRTFRDKQIAHWGELTKPPPIINDIFAVTRSTAAALERLAQGTGAVTLNLDSQLMVYRDKARRFWEGESAPCSGL